MIIKIINSKYLNSKLVLKATLTNRGENSSSEDLNTILNLIFFLIDRLATFKLKESSRVKAEQLRSQVITEQ
jgi:hypothetical protein